MHKQVPTPVIHRLSVTIIPLMSMRHIIDKLRAPVATQQTMRPVMVRENVWEDSLHCAQYVAWMKGRGADHALYMYIGFHETTQPRSAMRGKGGTHWTHKMLWA